MFSHTAVMKCCVHVLVLALVTVALSGTIPSKEEKHGQDRVIDKDLSDKEHFPEGYEDEHNPDYDHEAFLGKEDAKRFDQLTPEESKERLGKIYEKIDKDNNGQVTEDELKEWIQYVQKHYIYSDTDRQWKEFQTDDSRLSWDEYKARTYGDIEDQEEEDAEDGYSYQGMIKRDERRWKKADRNSDGYLNKEEFADFLHPEDVEHMREIVIDETLEDIDKNKDGVISIDEYIGDMYSSSEDPEPEWVQSERHSFTEERDINEDGVMDREEVLKWIVPDDFDHIEAESRHLVSSADGNQDGLLSKEEVLNNYDVFVGSQATDYGEALTHDEF